MKQIFLIVSAMTLGLGYGSLTGGFSFSSAVCLVAGIFLVTPSLFKFQVSDLGIIKNNLPSVSKNLWINFVLLTAVALGIGFLTNDIGIAAALFLLALLPGGGMVMMWIKQSRANVKLGFILFMLNLALLLPITLVFGQFQSIAGGWFPAPDLTLVSGLDVGASVKPIAPFIILIVIPFILSRIALYFLPSTIGFVGKHQKFISKSTMFGIVFYLFALSTSQLLFGVTVAQFFTALIATVVFYTVTIAAAILLTDNTSTGKAVFWHIATRYITLALILAVFNVGTYGATFILPIMMAYFIQIGAAGFLSQRQLRPSLVS